MNLFFALLASCVLSLVSLIGIFTLAINDQLLKRMTIFLVAFAAGGLIGGAFLDLLPEAMEYIKDPTELFFYVILGYLLFFVLEKYLYLRHCHDAKCEAHAFTYLNIVGDIVHNFGDGLIVGAVFLVDIKVGIATTLAIVCHEIPHEVGNFMVLLYGGFSRRKALLFNFLSSLFAILGTLTGFYFAQKVDSFSSILLPVAAGGFIYIASCDLIPEFRQETDLKKSALTMATFISGILLMYGLTVLLE